MGGLDGTPSTTAAAGCSGGVGVGVDVDGGLKCWWGGVTRRSVDRRRFLACHMDVIPGVRTVLSVASWAEVDTNCTLTVDYHQLGFTEAQSARARARGLVAMPIDQFQPATRFPFDSELPIQSSKGYFGLSGRQSRPHIQPGWLLVIEPGEGTERASTNGG